MATIRTKRAWHRAALVTMLLLAAVPVSGCSYDFEAPFAAGGGSQGGGGSGAGAGGEGTGGSAGSGEGGTSVCGVSRVPADTPCGGLTEEFVDADEVSLNWSRVGGQNGDVFVDDDALHVVLRGTDTATYAETKEDLTIQGCSVWAKIVASSPDPGIATRLSIGVEGDPSAYNFGIQDGDLAARDGENDPLATLRHDVETMRYVRLREEKGTLHYDYSGDAVCWTELASIPLGETFVGRGRLALVREETAATSSEGVFDDWGLPKAK